MSSERERDDKDLSAFTPLAIARPRPILRTSARARSLTGFTLIELLIVIAVIAILSIVVVLTLNPAQMLQQGRDENRLSDMDTISHAISLYQTDQATIGASGPLGSQNTVYVSLPDPNASTTAGDACSSLGLPSLPLGWTYHCAGPGFFRKTDGTGWIPVNFSSVTTGSPLGSLPIDPTNASSSRLYYAYATNGSSYEVTSPMESQKYRLGGANDAVSGDGGTLASVYEKGSALGLMPLDYGDPTLVGYWPMDEGSGNTAWDWSGNNASGTWQGGLVNGSHYAPGKIGGWAGEFVASDTDYVTAGTGPILGDNFSIGMWVYSYGTQVASGQILFQGSRGGVETQPYGIAFGGDSIYASISNPSSTPVSGGSRTINYASDHNQWHQIWFIDRNKSLEIYLDGVLSGGTPVATNVTPDNVGPLTLYIGRGKYLGSPYYRLFNGLLDDVRIYNRALSAAEIQELYSAGK